MLQSIIRTLVPLIVGWLLSLAILRGVDADSLTELVTAGVTALYYVAVRLLERVDARWGWLLGAKGQPVYPTQTLGKITED